MLRYITLVALLGGLASVPATADSVDVDASRDNTIYEESDDLSNGAGSYFFAGRTAGGDRRRGLLAFDVVGSIPGGSTITGVTLTLYMSRTVSGGENVGLHPLLDEWGEGSSNASGQEGGGDDAENGDATWRYRFYNVADPGSAPQWTSLGGDYAATASATTSVGDEGYYAWSSAEMVTDVQGWLDAPASSYGWILLGNEATPLTAKRFNSRQNNNDDERPVLTVTFDPPGVTGACCFDDGDCLEFVQTSCTSQGGSFQGDGTSCTPNTCPQPTGACCFETGVCVVLTEADCLFQNQTYLGDFSSCNPNPCNLPEGACCFDDGHCEILTENDCDSQGGDYQGDGTACVPNTCPQPTGACCFSGADCMELTELDCIAQAGGYLGDGTECTPNPCPLNLEHFVDALPIPSVVQPVSNVAGTPPHYEITMEEVQQQLHRDLDPTTVWGYNGLYPGPTIENTTGEPMTVNWINNLKPNKTDDHYLTVDTCMHGPDHAGTTARAVVHVHGGHVRAKFDGYPENTLLPTEQALYEYPNNQLPATIWYHDHALGITRLNVYMGLAGFYLIRDAFELGLGLPSGQFEVPIVIQDRTFNLDGTWSYPDVWQGMFFGDTILCNGKVWPYLEVTRGKYRFRLLNGSNSRTYRLALQTGDPFQLIGTDGGLLPEPITMTEVLLAPAERADVIMDFTDTPVGTDIVLTNSAPAPFPGTPGVGVIPDIMQFRVVAGPAHTDPIPTTLRPMEVLDEMDADRSRNFVLRKDPATAPPCAGPWWLINDLAWDDITEFPNLGDTEIWVFQNPSNTVHPMHMHLVFFQVLDRQAIDVNGDVITPVGDPMPPDASESGWKDTVRVEPLTQVRVIARFEDYTGKYSYHCHILEHEDHEMMRQFQIPCVGDTNDDREVNVTDLVNVILDWDCTDPPGPCMADTNQDGVVNVLDLLDVILAWGECP